MMVKLYEHFFKVIPIVYPVGMTKFYPFMQIIIYSSTTINQIYTKFGM